MHAINAIILFLIIVITRTKVSTFNIETRNPYVKKAPAKNTYFGFSVAQHAVTENSQNADDYWILVGAPLGENLQPNTNRSGALFKCPVTSKPKDCEQIETDGKRFDEFDYDDVPSLRNPPTLEGPGVDEIKEDQWLGVTVKSQKAGGEVVVCAHRYIQSPNVTLYHYGMGLCYLLSNDLVTKEALQPCKGRPKEKLHQQYGFCQVGTSLAVLDDGFVLMGSPGPYTWRGTVFATSVVGSFLEKDNTVYKGPLNDTPIPLDKYSYLGMSVTGGRFFKKDVVNFVSGAPRSNNNGQVFFFKRTKSIEDLSIVLIISGTQFGSSFGYEILAVDIDQDGLDELLVAAPFYYETQGNGVGGAVYLYNNFKHCNLSVTSVDCSARAVSASAVFKGKKESRFGFAMTSLGDINKDGHLDVAIGAPYEDGGGAVYIYLGKGNGLSSEPSQIIKHPGFKTIGYSMSAGLDMDLNGYSDLLVGAYESDMVLLYKTRPIIDINITVEGKELKNINASRKGCRFDLNSNKTCFSFQTCFTLSEFRLTQAVDIKYELKEISKKIPRVTFQTGSKIMSVTNNSGNCINEVAYLVESNGDILTKIKLQVNYTIHNDVVDSPILNKTSVKNFEATFQKNCGSDDVCLSNLILNVGTSLNKTEDGYILDMGKNKEFVLETNVTNKGESAYEAKLFVMHPEGLSYIALQTEKNKTAQAVCTSNNESTLVTCNLGNPFQENHSAFLRLRFEIADTKQQKLDLNVSVNSTSRELSNQTSQSMSVILEKIGQYVIKGESRPQNILYSGQVKGQSAMKDLSDIGPRVIHSYDVINKGDWNIRGVTVRIYWPYQVFTKRPEGGKWLLYLEAVPSVDGLSNSCTVTPSEIVNPLGLNSSRVEEDNNVEDPFGRGFTEPPGNVRRKRDAEEVVKVDTMVGPDQKERKIVSMDCVKKTASCALIICNIPELRENNEIKINISARVWNSTLIEDYSQVDWVSIRSLAELDIRDTSIKASDTVISSDSIETKAYPAVVLAEKGVNIWIIIGSVLAGLILLVLVIFILYKCGFFKRNRVKDHTLSANLKKQGENETLLNEGKPTKNK